MNHVVAKDLIQRTLSNIEMEECKGLKQPMENINFDNDTSAAIVENKYRSLIGSLLNLTRTLTEVASLFASGPVCEFETEMCGHLNS